MDTQIYTGQPSKDLTWELAKAKHLDAHFAPSTDVNGIPKIELLVNWKVSIHESLPKLTPTAEQHSDYRVQIMSGGERWGLENRGWGIDRHCAEFYLLMLSSITDPKYQKYLNKKTDILAEQFSGYTDMAVGGEIRHVRPKMFREIPKPLLKALRNKTIGRSAGNNPVSRSSAWLGWYHFRQQYGSLALRWAVKVFGNGMWSSAYGGDKWGAIANTLLMYETGELAKASFVDACFGLQHNGGIYFNKWWDKKLYELEQVMDANLEGRYCYLYRNSSKNLQILLNKEEIMKVCQCYDHGGGS